MAKSVDQQNSFKNARKDYRKYGMTGLDTVLHQVVDKLGLDRRLKEHALCSLWPDIVGSALASRSRAALIDPAANLVVSAQDASVAQELSMLRPKILSKVLEIARSLGVEVRGVRIDMRNYRTVQQPVLLEEENTLPEPSTQDLMKVELRPEDKHKLAEMKKDFESDAKEGQNVGYHESLLKIYEKQLKLERWRIEHGYPECSLCRTHVRKLRSSSQSGQQLCHICILNQG